MGDRSRIAILNNNGSVESIYTHWNGMLEGNGAILYQHYNDTALVKQLIELGDVSELKQNLAPPPGETHTWNSPYPQTSMFYTRDKKEPLRVIRHHTLESYINSSYFEHRNYLYYEKKKMWYVIDSETHKLKKLSTLLLQSENVSEETKNIIKIEKFKNKLENKLNYKEDIITEKKFKI